MLVVLLVGVGAIGFVWGHSSATSAAAHAAAASAKASKAAQDARISKAYNACSEQDSDNTLQLGDGGRTIIVDTRSEYTSVDAVNCVLSQLKTPESITADIGSTTALMGEKSAQSDGISYRWSYHPDNGLNMVITENG